MADAVKEIERRPLFVSRSAKPVAATAGPVILFTAGGMRFAVEASEVEEIRDRDDRTAIRKLKGSESIDFALQVGLGAGILERFVVLKPGDVLSGRDRSRAHDELVPKWYRCRGCSAERSASGIAVCCCWRTTWFRS